MNCKQMERPTMQSQRAADPEFSELMTVLVEQSKNISKAIAENLLAKTATDNLEKKQLQIDALLIQTAFPSDWRDSLLDSSDRVLALLPKKATCNIIKSLMEENFLLRAALSTVSKK